MIDKTKFRCTAKKQGDVVVIHVYGDGSCLWLNMYLDKDWQMVCDSDIGTYAYNWHGHNGVDAFVAFCCDWLADEDWLLRKCVEDKHEAKYYDLATTKEALIDMCKAYVADWSTDDKGNYMADINELLEDARHYRDYQDYWVTAMYVLSEDRGIDLPECWYECVVSEYTPRQKRFAEICREVIVPELKKLMDEELPEGMENIKCTEPNTGFSICLADVYANPEKVQAMIDQKPDVMSYPIWMTKVELDED